MEEEATDEVMANAAQFVMRATKAAAAAGDVISTVHVRRKRGGKRVREAQKNRALQVEVQVEGQRRQKLR